MNDFDIWQKAINKMDLTEAVAPVIRGVMLVEDSQVEMYNKIQKLLNSTGMESCHRFLYNLDPSELSESECQKVCNLYKLGQDRGFIEPDVVEDEADESNTEGTEVKKECDLAPAAQPIQPSPSVIPMQQNAFTVLYSATRDGIVKSGEAFSNCVNTRSAKADVISKLERAGYQNISILAIEAGDPDMARCENTYCAQASQAVPDYAYEAEDVEEKDDEEDIGEADDREPLSHALDAVGVKASTANSKAQDAVQLNIEEKDDDSDDEKNEDNEQKAEDKSEKKDDDSSEDKEDKEDKKEAAEEPDEKLKDDKSSEKSDDEKKDDEDKDDDEELSASDKENLKDSYKKAFKAAMKKCKFETSFSDLSLEDKVKFFTELSKAWGDKADPSKFMTDKEVDQLEKIIVSK